ncbi:hypothetical protein [Jeotgalibacillus soli]|uniref:Uncharacterized protein n=1 Tax=Jeotgalibacillus soli TaxID=889306 RepID=A0A0C2W1W1_9BACL|nr:hypothetical protein [Jeotgalibacillus soli]KIL50611.1 hypothetical protein KP78_06120 [Jeotgalibacillus soli]
MSNRNNLKDKIKKPNASQAFFNSYDKKDDNLDNDNNNEVENKNANDGNNKTNNNVKNNDNNNNIDSNNVIDKDKTYVNNDNVVNVKDNDDNYLRDLAAGKKAIKKKPKKVFTSFYMDPDLAAEVDKIASRGEKGDKSKLINKGIRTLLEEYGVISKN